LHYLFESAIVSGRKRKHYCQTISKKDIMSISNYSSRKSNALRQANLLPEVDETVMRRKLTEYQQVADQEVDSALENLKEVCQWLEESYDADLDNKAKQLFASIKYNKPSSTDTSWEEISSYERDYLRRKVEMIEADLSHLGIDFQEYINRQFS
jgi:tRNA/tmRNA/rRNA uracil-C5-methylase (TrmA/RlmC/RlmD family)